MARAGAGEVHVWARRRSQANALVRHCAEHLAIRFPNTRFKVLARVPESSADIYINATPLGMKGFKTNRLLPKQVRRGAWAFDLVYRPEDTSFLRQAKKRNLKCIGGLDMLIWQALATRKIWFRQQSEPYVKIKLKRRLRSIISGKRS
ncbi:MAG TPA: hypothetical protein DCS07_05255 [Bdellovibrionales bacterium]|nr:hypothetical protein [Bdellovibrionales bacterium]